MGRKMSYKRQKWEYFANLALIFYIWNILISIGGALVCLA